MLKLRSNSDKNGTAKWYSRYYTKKI